MSPQEYAKAIAALIGGILTAAVSQGLLHGTAAAWAAIVGTALTTGLVFLVPNRPPAGQPADPDLSEQG